MSKYNYRKRLSKKLLCNNRYGLKVNGSIKSKMIYELINLYPNELWTEIYSKGSDLSLVSTCYQELYQKVKSVSPSLIEELKSRKRKHRVISKAKRFFGSI